MFFISWYAGQKYFYNNLVSLNLPESECYIIGVHAHEEVLIFYSHQSLWSLTDHFHLLIS